VTTSLRRNEEYKSNDIRKGKQTPHKTKEELIESYPNLLPYLNSVECPKCGVPVNVNQVNRSSDIPVGWCDNCNIGVE